MVYEQAAQQPTAGDAERFSFQIDVIMKIKKRVLAPLVVLVLSSIGARSADFQIPDGNLARKFFERTTVSLTPVYGVMKNRSDHVVTVHGFVDNAEICKELVEVLNKPVPAVFTCQKLHDGALK